VGLEQSPRANDRSGNPLQSKDCSGERGQAMEKRKVGK